MQSTPFKTSEKSNLLAKHYSFAEWKIQARYAGCNRKTKEKLPSIPVGAGVLNGVQRNRMGTERKRMQLKRCCCCRGCCCWWGWWGWDRCLGLRSMARLCTRVSSGTLRSITSATFWIRFSVCLDKTMQYIVVLLARDRSRRRHRQALAAAVL